MRDPVLVPELYVRDVKRSLAFYRDVIGFQVKYDRPEEGFAWIYFEGAHLMLDQYSGTTASTDEEFARGAWRTGDFEYPLGRGVNFEMDVKDVLTIYNKIVTAQYPVKLPLYDKWYRTGSVELQVKQFLVLDPDGYLLRFSQKMRERAISTL